jgi:hypothetical protein
MDIIDEVMVWSILGIAVVLVLAWVTPAFILLLTQGEEDPESGQHRSVIDWGDRKPERKEGSNSESSHAPPAADQDHSYRQIPPSRKPEC